MYKDDDADCRIQSEASKKVKKVKKKKEKKNIFIIDRVLDRLGYNKNRINSGIVQFFM